MSLATTLALCVAVVDGTAGVGQVHSRVRTATDRDDAETAMVDAGAINSWEISVNPSRLHEGASAETRTALEVDILAHWKHDDAGNSRADFVTAIEAVMTRLADPEIGFPQIDEAGITLTERPDVPVRTRTGASAYRARLRFNLLDVEST